MADDPVLDQGAMAVTASTSKRCPRSRRSVAVRTANPIKTKVRPATDRPRRGSGYRCRSSGWIRSCCNNIRLAPLEGMRVLVGAKLLRSAHRIWRNRWGQVLRGGNGRRGPCLRDEPTVDFGEFGE